MKSLAKRKNVKLLRQDANREENADMSVVFSCEKKSSAFASMSGAGLFVLIFFLFFVSPSLYAKPKNKVLVLPVTGTINGATALFIERSQNKAAQEDYSLLILEINSNGGLVDSAQKIKKLLLSDKVKTAAFVNNHALSAAALIAICCNNIYMAQGSDMGAATPFKMNTSGTSIAPVEAKFLSAFKAEFTSAAEARHRDIRLAAAMVDPEHETIDGLVKKGEILTFTTEQAYQHGYCDGIVKDAADIAMMQGFPSNVQIDRVKPTPFEKYVMYLRTPWVTGLVFAVGFWGIVIEIFMPGFGVFGVIGVLAMLSFFWQSFFMHLAGFEMILLFGLGVLLLLLEIFVIPGFGVTGFSGILCIIGSVIMGFGGLQQIWDAITALLLYSFIFGFLAWKLIPRTKLLHPLINDTAMTPEAGYTAVEPSLYEHLKGMEGMTASVCRPSGKIRVGGELYDAVSEGEFIESGEHVLVINVEGNKITVRRIAG